MAMHLRPAQTQGHWVRTVKYDNLEFFSLISIKFANATSFSVIFLLCVPHRDLFLFTGASSYLTSICIAITHSYSSASSQKSALSNRPRSSRQPRPRDRPHLWWGIWGHLLMPYQSFHSLSPPLSQPPHLAEKAGKTKCKCQSSWSGSH